MVQYNPDAGELFETTASSEAAGKRLDAYLAGILAGQSRSFIKKIMDDGFVEVDGARAKPSRKLAAGDRISLFIPELIELEARPEAMDLDILYEDADLIVINKPPGRVVHPSPGHETGSIVNGLLHHCRDLSGIGGVLRPGIVHRLDRDTSGAMVAAKNDQAHQGLAAQFAERTTEKIYLALVHGAPAPPHGTIDLPIGRHPAHRVRMAVDPESGKHAVTHYETAEQHGEFSLIRCRLETGRTHQIRVHLSHRGWPILADAAYGREQALSRADLLGRGSGQATGDAVRIVLDRQALHAHTLAFTHPRTGERIRCTAPVPAVFENVLSILRSAKKDQRIATDEHG